MIVDLSYENPHMYPFMEMQRWKTPPTHQTVFRRWSAYFLRRTCCSERRFQLFT
ncbi:hypothetical protein ABVN80_03810 [Acinetobacter baumannii]